MEREEYDQVTQMAQKALETKGHRLIAKVAAGQCAPEALRALLASLNGPSVYDTMISEGRLDE